MSTPPDQMAKQQLAQSHDIAHKAAAAHTAGLAKMMQALASLPAGAGTAAPGDNDGDEGRLPNAPGAYDSMPDPSSWVLHDPQGAASYLDALAEAFAQLALNAGSAPQGAPMQTPMSSPSVGGESGGAAY